MARAAAKGGKRPRQDARQRQQRQQQPSARSARRQLSQTEQALFFSRLRRQAKWAFAVLAVLFAVTFAFLGVGSGSGLDFTNLFGGGGGSKTSISGAKKRTEKNPRDAKAWQDLALAYQRKSGFTAEAIAAQTKYTQLRPKDAAGYTALAQLQITQADNLNTIWQAAAARYQSLQTSASSPIQLTGKLSGALGSDPLTTAAQAEAADARSAAATQEQQADQAYQGVITTLRKAAALRPRDVSTQLLIRAVAGNAYSSLFDPLTGQRNNAYLRDLLAANTRLIKLDPTNAADYRKQLKQVRQALHPTGR